MISSEDFRTFLDSQTHHSSSNGLKLANDVVTSSELLLHWISFLTSTRLTGNADQLLEGVQAAIVETAAVVSIGILRPSLSSIRSQVDMMLAWIFFKDHPIEWSAVHREADHFKLKRDALKYLEEMYPGYKTRYSLLNSKRVRINEDPYKILSVHIHAQTASAIPLVTPFEGLIASSQALSEVAVMQGEVSEFLSDILVSAFTEDYLLMPPHIKNNVEARLSKEALRQLTL